MKTDRPPDDGVTRDGCPVEVYAALPDDAVAETISRLLPPGATILDLGAGTGRIADPLARRGHRVVAVDNSVGMLAHLTSATGVAADIERLALAMRFDAVILASHLINVPARATRRAFLATVAAHLAPRGRALVEWHPPAWFDGLTPGTSSGAALGCVETELQVHELRGDLLRASVTYRVDGRTWTQPFFTRRLTGAEVTADLAAAGLVCEAPLAGASGWLLVRPQRRS